MNSSVTFLAFLGCESFLLQLVEGKVVQREGASCPSLDGKPLAAFFPLCLLKPRATYHGCTFFLAAGPDSQFYLTLAAVSCLHSQGLIEIDP